MSRRVECMARRDAIGKPWPRNVRYAVRHGLVKTPSRATVTVRQGVPPADGVWLRTPEFGVAANSPAIADFRQWLAYLAGPNDDPATEIMGRFDWLRNGVVIPSAARQYGPGDTAYRWQRRQVRVPAGGSSGTLHRLRFHVMDEPLGGNFDTYVEGGIDDVTVYHVASCQDCCDGDTNRDGNVDQSDIEYLVQIVAGGPNPVGTDPDWNHDGNVDQDDVTSLINYTAGEPCPF